MTEPKKPAVCKRCTSATRKCACGRACCPHLITKAGTCGPCNLAKYNATRKAAKAAPVSK